MANYAQTPLPDFLSVKSINSVFYVDLTNESPAGEAHNFWEFLYVDNGIHSVSVDGTAYTLGEGQLIMYAPLAWHCLPKPSSAKVIIVSFSSDSEGMSFFANKVITLSSKQRKILSHIIESGEKCFEKSAPDAYIIGMVPRKEASITELQKLKCELELLLIDIYASNENETAGISADNYENYNTESFEKIRSYLLGNLGKNLSLSDICRNCSVSLSRLKSICRRQCGKSPISYFIDLKIIAAKEMIRDTSQNFTQISEALGFSTVHYFSKLFKARTGMTPSEYAKSVYKKQRL